MKLIVHNGIPETLAINACDVMVLSAHPDDAEFGAAGSVIHWVDNGLRVVYAVATDGDKGSSDRSLSPEALAAIRRKEQTHAAESVGVSELVYMGYPDQGLEETPGLRKDVVRLLRIYRPRKLVTSDPYRRYLWHRDHRVIGQVAMDAVYPYARDHMAYPDLLEQGLEPHKVAEILFWGADEINHVMDVTDTFDRKIEALYKHASQMREFKSTDPAEWLKERCREMARNADFDLAEGFHRVVLPG
jgi:LmbE family N-acetylglucosaminyl deacetylase